MAGAATGGGGAAVAAGAAPEAAAGGLVHGRVVDGAVLAGALVGLLSVWPGALADGGAAASVRARSVPREVVGGSAVVLEAGVEGDPPEPTSRTEAVVTMATTATTNTSNRRRDRRVPKVARMSRAPRPVRRRSGPMYCGDRTRPRVIELVAEGRLERRFGPRTTWIGAFPQQVPGRRRGLFDRDGRITFRQC